MLIQLSMVIEHHYSDLFQAISTDLRKPFLVPGQGSTCGLVDRGFQPSRLRNYLTATGAENPRILVTINGQDVALDI